MTSCVSVPGRFDKVLMFRSILEYSVGEGALIRGVAGAAFLSLLTLSLPAAMMSPARANTALRSFIYLLVGVFVFLFATVNILLYLLVVKPVRRLRTIADQVGLGELNAPEFLGGGSEEITSLAQAFNRMRRSLVEALKMLQ